MLQCSDYVFHSKTYHYFEIVFIFLQIQDSLCLQNTIEYDEYCKPESIPKNWAVNKEETYTCLLSKYKMGKVRNTGWK